MRFVSFADNAAFYYEWHVNNNYRNFEMVYNLLLLC